MGATFVLSHSSWSRFKLHVTKSISELNILSLQTILKEQSLSLSFPWILNPHFWNARMFIFRMEKLSLCLQFSDWFPTLPIFWNSQMIFVQWSPSGQVKLCWESNSDRDHAPSALIMCYTCHPPLSSHYLKIHWIKEYWKIPKNAVFIESYQCIWWLLMLCL